MAWAEWMVVAPTLEEELHLETDARAIIEDDDHKDIAKLCAELSKQNWYQQKLIEQAVAHVMELEAQLACLELSVAEEKSSKPQAEKKKSWGNWFV